MIPFPIIKTERLLLRQLKHGDVKEVFFLRSDPVVMRYLDKEPAKSLQEATEWIQKIDAAEANNEVVNWGICLHEDLKVIGNICLWNINKEHHRAEIGYVLHPSMQGKGIMQEAAVAVIKYGFHTLKLHSIEANVNPANESSIRLLERNKFIREAYFKENYFFNNRFLDSAIYSLLTDVSY